MGFDQNSFISLLDALRANCVICNQPTGLSSTVDWSNNPMLSIAVHFGMFSPVTPTWRWAAHRCRRCSKKSYTIIRKESSRHYTDNKDAIGHIFGGLLIL